MNRKLHLFLAAAVMVFASFGFMQQPPAPPKTTISGLSPRKFTETISGDYLLFLPRDYDANSGKRWPLILFLHGAGERGADVWRAATHGPTKYIAQHPEFPFILAVPVCPAGKIWSHEVLLGILDDVTAKNAVDTNRVYLTGLSMGGFGSWSLALQYPERFAAVAPICGGEGALSMLLSLGDSTKSSALKSLPIWAFHGGKDPVVPLAESERMVAMLKKAGVTDVKLTVYPEAQHDSWTETYNNPELYAWFLAHERKR